MSTNPFSNSGGALAILAPKITRITTSGTFTPDPRTLYAIIEMVGGGGGAGGTASIGAGQCCMSGSGSSGGYLRFYLTAAQLGVANIPVTIGAGGTAGAASVAGGGGGNTLFGLYASCNGGGGGTAAPAVSTVLLQGPTPSTNATATLTTGTLLSNVGNGVQNGSFGFCSPVSGSVGSVPGSNPLSPAQRSRSFVGNGFSSIPGVSFGGGAMGACGAQNSGALAGAAGAVGIIIVSEYFQ